MLYIYSWSLSELQGNDGGLRWSQVSGLPGQSNVMRQNLFDQTSLQLDSIASQLTDVEAFGGEADPTVDSDTDQLRVDMIDRLETLQNDLLALAQDGVRLTIQCWMLACLCEDIFGWICHQNQMYM